MNTIGSFECVCRNGHEGSGLNCTDLDECTLGQSTKSNNVQFMPSLSRTRYKKHINVMLRAIVKIPMEIMTAFVTQAIADPVSTVKTSTNAVHRICTTAMKKLLV